MAGQCTIARDNKGEIQEVYAPNNKPSTLFKDIIKSISNASKEGKEQALKIWARAYTPTFKDKFGDWELVSEAFKYVDNIKGMYKDVFNLNPQRALYEISAQSHGNKVEKTAALQTFGPELIKIASKLFPNAKPTSGTYVPVITAQLDTNGEPVIESVLNKTERSQQTKIEVAPEVKGMTPIAQLKDLVKSLVFLLNLMET